jgi:hypothetical protein
MPAANVAATVSSGFRRKRFCVVKKFRSGADAIFGRAPGGYDTIFQRVGNSGYRTGCAVRCVVKLLAHLFEY